MKKSSEAGRCMMRYSHSFGSVRKYISESGRFGSLNARRINRITDYIAEHYRERISLEDIAALENITTYHASHRMKNAFGISFQEYLNTIRLEAAVRLLRQTDLNLLDICLENGFSGSRYLNRTIQKTFGCTAKEYRKNPQAPPQVPSLPASDLQRRYTFEQAAAILFPSKNIRKPVMDFRM